MFQNDQGKSKVYETHFIHAVGGSDAGLFIIAITITAIDAEIIVIINDSYYYYRYYIYYHNQHHC